MNSNSVHKNKMPWWICFGVEWFRIVHVENTNFPAGQGKSSRADNSAKKINEYFTKVRECVSATALPVRFTVVSWHHVRRLKLYIRMQPRFRAFHPYCTYSDTNLGFRVLTSDARCNFSRLGVLVASTSEVQSPLHRRVISVYVDLFPLLRTTRTFLRSCF